MYEPAYERLNQSLDHGHRFGIACLESGPVSGPGMYPDDSEPVHATDNMACIAGKDRQT